jgi:hypothetical protein
MATVTKDFKVKNGLIVEGTTGTINNHDILTKKQDDQNYIIGLIGGTATPDATPETVVKRDENGSFSADTVTADLVGDVTGNADTATALETARTISLAGDVTGSVSFDGTANVSITATIDGSFATDAEVATAKGEAISDAGDYTDGEILTLDASLKAYADQAETDAVASAGSYTDGRENAITAAYEAYADQAEVDAKAYTDTREIAITSAYEAYADQAETDAIASANSYTDSAVANLVDSAPETLDTLNELAAALQDNPDIISDLQTIAAGKQDTLTAGSNIDITDSTISVTGLTSAEISDFNSAALSATSAAYDAAGSAATAETDANSYTDGEITLALSTAQGYADDAEADAISSANSYTDSAISGVNSTIAALDTDDVAEGSNLYYTTSRAKTDAAALITGATKTNIVITGDENGLTITAENGVADSDTDDLAEGSTNLYFTDARAVSALEAVTPDFPAVDIASVAKQVAASSSITTASTNTAVSWAKAEYRSAEFLVKIANGSHTEVSKVVLTLDTSDNIAITEYAMVGTNGALGSVSADVSGTDVRLRVTTDNNNSDVKVVGTLLK